MAKLLIFDNLATVNSSGDPISFPFSAIEFARSLPVRLFAGNGEVRHVAYEFLLTGTRPNTVRTIFWFQQFYNDAPVQLGFPGARLMPPNARLDWTREQCTDIGPGGTLTHYNITRQVAMSIPTDEVGDSRYFPMTVHAYWGRLAVRIAPVPAGNDGTRLRIYAISGAYSEREARYFRTIQVPYSGILPDNA